jgi:penicillin-binding protein 1B
MPRFYSLLKFILILSAVVLATYQQRAFSQNLKNADTVQAADTATTELANKIEPSSTENVPEQSTSVWGFLSDITRKLNSKSFLKSTQYYARGTSFAFGDLVNLDLLQNGFQKSGFRLRNWDQSLLENDFAILEAQNCSNLIQEAVTSITKCLMWKTKYQKTFVMIFDHQPDADDDPKNDTYVITRILILDPKTEVPTAELEPILVAQYRGKEPVMQVDKKLADIPLNCLNAVIAIEDNQFLEHGGVSITGLGRAILKNIISLRKAQGGSTITQQLVKNYFLTPEKTFSRKAKEIIMAIQLESQWSKDEILETYLNIIYMGQAGAFQVLGFGAASQVYFDKSLSDLNLQECALLAAIVNNPGLNNPWKRAEQAKRRRTLVLSKMVEFNLITENEKNLVIDSPLPVQKKSLATETAPYFFEAVRMQATNLQIPIDGTTFFTSLELSSQEKAQRALQAGILEREKNKKANQSLQGVVLSAHLQSGLITTLVGGQNFRQTQFNRALNSKRQIGSLIKPIIYLSALLDSPEVYSPTFPLMDEPFVWEYDNKKWSPVNYEKNFRGEVPFYFALKQSLNVPTAALAQKVGLDKAIDLAHKIGLESPIPPTPSSSLGASTHTPMEILQAYSTIALMGLKHELSFITSAQNSDGEEIYKFSPQNQQVYDQTQGAVLVGMMKETLRSGTAKAANAFGFKSMAAGKTGTTSNNMDVWFAGFTPTMVSVVWLGYDEGRSTKLTGASGALPIWSQFMAQVTSNKSQTEFPWPNTVEEREVNSTSVNETTKLIFKK